MSDTRRADPLASLISCWRQAQFLKDPAANFVALATLDESGNPATRMLTLRHMDDKGAVFYVNADSPKSLQLRADTRHELLFFWTSLMVSARMRGEIRYRRDPSFLEGWRQKPLGSRYADRLHTRLAQSAAIASRSVLIDELATLREVEPNPQDVPDALQELIVAPNWLEILRISDADRLHNRTAWVRNGDYWKGQTLVP
ncbi:MAG: pyridoxamine 5'-phosphate oxidase family protein [Burkholderiales bacterium]|nr:pyridoxamine 5'-phosphate oxidase family protein [Burkholderiales bacterium]